jgi:hypothetical protein
MSGAILQVLVGGVALTVVFALLASTGVKYFARHLPYSTAFLISLVGFAVCTVLYVLYFIAQTAMALPRSADGLFGLVALSIAGTIITKLARNYGVEKKGWLGIGAKSVFMLVGLSWVVVGIVYLGMQLQ